MMHDDPMGAAMFWVGALFVFTPIVLAGIVIGMWWYTRRREREAKARAARSPELAAPRETAPSAEEQSDRS